MSLLVVGGIELLYRWLKLRLSPWFWIVMGLILTAWTAFRWLRIKPKLENMALGARGERIVGRKLEELRKYRYVVFHDIPGEGFNIDHVVIGPGGVFALETKSWSKPESGPTEIDYDGERVLKNGRETDRNPVIQAKACASYLRGLLKKKTGRKVEVRAVLLFPGWFVKERSKNPEVWALNEKRIFSCIKNEREKLSREDIALFVDRLEHHLSEE